MQALKFKNNEDQRISVVSNIEEGDASEKTTLPLRLLVCADLCGKKPVGALETRIPTRITENTFDQVMSYFAPECSVVLSTANKVDKTRVDLKFKSLQDFSPDSLLTKIPAFRKLCAMRNAIKDLHYYYDEKPQLQKQLSDYLENNSVETLRDSILFLVSGGVNE